jgi:hypothetical protein
MSQFCFIKSELFAKYLFLILFVLLKCKYSKISLIWLACGQKGAKILNILGCQVLPHRWEDNIKMDLHEEVWGDVDWINLTQDRDRWWVLVNAVLNLWVP